ETGGTGTLRGRSCTRRSGDVVRVGRLEADGPVGAGDLAGDRRGQRLPFALGQSAADVPGTVATGSRAVLHDGLRPDAAAAERLRLPAVPVPAATGGGSPPAALGGEPTGASGVPAGVAGARLGGVVPASADLAVRRL